MDLCYDFGGHLRADVPPVPNIPVRLIRVVGVDMGLSVKNTSTCECKQKKKETKGLVHATHRTGWPSPASSHVVS